MNMGEPFDVYTDSFAVTVNPWGANLNLFLSQAQPADWRAVVSIALAPYA